MAATGVVIRPSYSVFNFIYAACTPYALIDGARYTLTWGANFVPLAPGQHHVRVFTVYTFYSQCGAADASVMVDEGRTPTVTWRAPSFAFVRGGIQVYADTAPDQIPPYAALPGGGWAPMPASPEAQASPAASAPGASSRAGTSARSLTCARCGAACESGTRYCRKCGSPLGAQEEKPNGSRP